jgi:hypothetical protein
VIEMNSEKELTSNSKVEFGGILGGDPEAPYAYSGLQVSNATSPLFIVTIPSSQPLITCPGVNKYQYQVSNATSPLFIVTIPSSQPLITCPGVNNYQNHSIQLSRFLY